MIETPAMRLRFLARTSCMMCVIGCVCAACAAAGGQWDIVAGTGAAENNGDSGPATKINIGEPFGVEFGPDGALYVTEVRNHRVRRIDLTSGNVTTVAGCGRRGYAGDGGLAVDAELNEPYEVRFDADGNMYFVEMRNHVIRRVDGKSKTISTVAGTGAPGFSGDGGPATAAQMCQPHSIAIDNQGAIYVADIGNHRIRRIDTATGVIESIAGNSDRRIPHDGQAARGNALLGPRALCIADDTLWIALREGHSIWRMDIADGILNHVAGTGEAGLAGERSVVKQAQFNGPKGVALDAQGNLYIVDSENNAIRRIDSRSGVVTAINAKKSAAASSQMNQPHGICIGADGAVYVGDTLNHRVLRIK